MAKGKCKRRAKQIGLTVARTLTPAGMRLIGSIVGELATAELSNHAKREASRAAIKASFKEAKIEARDSIIELGREYAVQALKAGEEALQDLGQVDDSDLVDEPA